MEISSKIVILDTDFIFALFVQEDSSHLNAQNVLELIQKNNLEIRITNLVKQEIATLISRRIDQKTAIKVLEILEEFEIINISNEMEPEIWSLFKSFKKKNISFVDCSNLYTSEKLECKIASFDLFYGKERLLR